MLVIDASCLYEVVVGRPASEVIRGAFAEEGDLAAPHIIDVEVFGVLRREAAAGRLDRTAADQALMDLRDWPVDRFSHRRLVERGWELRDRVRGWDAMYVALAEGLGAPLMTMDRRLSRVEGLECEVRLVGDA